MTPDDDFDTDPQTSFPKRIAIYGFSGAVAGLAIAPLAILITVVESAVHWPLPWPQFFEAWSPFKSLFWQIIGENIGAFAGTPISGAVLGVLTCVLPYPFRRASFVALFWPSTCAAITVVVNYNLGNDKLKPSEAILYGYVIAMGVVFGLILGWLGRRLERRFASKEPAPEDDAELSR